MAQSEVGETYILAIWKKMRHRQSKRKRGVAKFRTGKQVRISKEKLNFAKGGEQNYTTELFKIRKALDKTLRLVYEMEDLLGTHIEGKLYS
jgi:hypothetical protein